MSGTEQRVPELVFIRKENPDPGLDDLIVRASGGCLGCSYAKWCLIDNVTPKVMGMRVYPVSVDEGVEIDSVLGKEEVLVTASIVAATTRVPKGHCELVDSEVPTGYFRDRV